MSLHQIVNHSTHILHCVYCQHPFKAGDWQSVFMFTNLHYKEAICGNCGKNVSLKVPFLGSGHDWLSDASLKRGPPKASELENKASA